MAIQGNEGAIVYSGSLGMYALGALTGVLPAALGANSEIFQFRWTDATRFAAINRIQIAAAVSTTFFAAGVPVQVDLVKATAWSAPGTGGTAITANSSTKARTSMGSSLVAAGDIRVATTAALGAGTKSLGTNQLGAILAAGPTAGPGNIFAPGTLLWDVQIADGEHPLVLAQNEGFVIRSVAVPITGTWQAAITVNWSEISAY